MTETRESSQYQRDRQIWRINTVKRNRRIALTVFVIILIFLFAGGVLFNQSRIVALNFEKAKLEEGIRKLTIANTQAESDLVESVNLEKIRKAALEMGLMDPAANQIRTIILAQEDTLETGEAENIK